MPKVFLSPSTQEFNQYATEGNEELYMNRIADRMEPYLRASGIQYVKSHGRGEVKSLQQLHSEIHDKE